MVKQGVKTQASKNDDAPVKPQKVKAQVSKKHSSVALKNAPAKEKGKGKEKEKEKEKEKKEKEPQEGKKKARKRNKKNKHGITKTMKDTYKAIRVTTQNENSYYTTPYTTFSRKLRRAILSQREPDMPLFTFKKGAIRLVQLAIEMHMANIGVAAAGIMDLMGVRQCKIDYLKYSEQLYNFFVNNQALPIKWIEECASLYKRRATRKMANKDLAEQEQEEEQEEEEEEEVASS
jgi:hypothetical protein